MSILERIRKRGVVVDGKPLAKPGTNLPPNAPKSVPDSFYHPIEEREAYYKTPEWAALRLARLRLDGFRCVMCNKIANQVHHRRYPDNLGEESVKDDLVSTCKKCHYNHHKSPGLDEYREAMEEEDWPDCLLCGQKIKKLNPHCMCEAKVRMLCDIADLNAQGIVWVKIQRDSTLIRAADRNKTLQRDAVHASRLYWFGLLERKSARAGEYQVSEKGWAFIQGKESVPAKIYCRGGTVVREVPTMVYIKDVRNIVLDKAYWDNYPSIQVTLKQITGGTP
jgi:hypothetical protein